MSEQNNENKGMNLGDELGKVFKMGVGAVAGAVEKGVSFVQDLTTEGTEANKRAAELGDQLTKKGNEALDKTVQFGEQLKGKVSDLMSSAPRDLDGWLSLVEALPDEHLNAIKAKIEDLLNARGQAAANGQPAGENQPGDDGQG